VITCTQNHPGADKYVAPDRDSTTDTRVDVRSLVHLDSVADLDETLAVGRE
jgi:hypothetical protein